MNASRLASFLATVAGLLWIVAGVAGWGTDAEGKLYLLGLGAFVLAMAATGYALVARAPVWLRAIVTIATPALGYMVWVTVRAAFSAGYLPVLGAGVLLVVGGAIGLTQAPTPKAQPVTRGRRALR
jgi:hypothetical protein